MLAENVLDPDVGCTGPPLFARNSHNRQEHPNPRLGVQAPAVVPLVRRVSR